MVPNRESTKTGGTDMCGEVQSSRERDTDVVTSRASVRSVKVATSASFHEGVQGINHALSLARWHLLARMYLGTG
jgi:hypothetical protein